MRTVARRCERGCVSGRTNAVRLHNCNITFIKVLRYVGCVGLVILDLPHVTTKLKARVEREGGGGGGDGVGGGGGEVGEVCVNEKSHRHMWV